MFDTLGYARHLKANGVPEAQAEAHAEAARNFLMPDLATGGDMEATAERQTLKLTITLGGLWIAGVIWLAVFLYL